MGDHSQLIQLLTEGFQGKLDQMDAARVQALALAAELSPRLDALYNPGLLSRVYVDAINGDDANSGKTAALAVKTWKRCGELFIPGAMAQVNMESDLDLDYLHIFRAPPTSITFLGRNGQKTVTAVATNENANVTGGARSFYAPIFLSFTNCDLVLNSSASTDAFIFESSHSAVVLNSASMSRIGGGAAKLFSNSSVGALRFYFINPDFDPSIQGYFLENLAAGANPNNVPGVYANITAI